MKAILNKNGCPQRETRFYTFYNPRNYLFFIPKVKLLNSDATMFQPLCPGITKRPRINIRPRRTGENKETAPDRCPKSFPPKSGPKKIESPEWLIRDVRNWNTGLNTRHCTNEHDSVDNRFMKFVIPLILMKAHNSTTQEKDAGNLKWCGAEEG